MNTLTKFIKRKEKTFEPMDNENHKLETLFLIFTQGNDRTTKGSKSNIHSIYFEKY